LLSGECLSSFAGLRGDRHVLSGECPSGARRPQAPACGCPARLRSSTHDFLAAPPATAGAANGRLPGIRRFEGARYEAIGATLRDGEPLGRRRVAAQSS
jgi:hypothetical protein